MGKVKDTLEKLKRNEESLERSLEKYGSRLKSVSIGPDLYFFAKIAQLSEKYGVTLRLNTKVPTFNYEMEFKDASLETLEKNVSTLVNSEVRVVQNASRKLKAELQKYVGRIGKCILELENGQLVVEFSDVTPSVSVAFPKENLEENIKIDVIYSNSVKLVYNNDCTTITERIPFSASKEEIKTFLLENQNVKQVIKETSYLLADLSDF